MKHILILLALVFSMASVQAQTTSPEEDHETGYKHYSRRDYKQAFELFEKLAKQGHAIDQFYLGVMYELGLGVDQDGKQAVDWYTKAANQDNVFAQYNLAVMYESGVAVDRDYTQTLNWYEKAAKLGLLQAQNNLGSLYEYGLGVEQNYVLAHMWYNISVTNRARSIGDNIALNSRDAIAKKMSSEQINEAVDKGITCFESKYQDCYYRYKTEK